MKASIITTLLLIFLAAPCAHAQQLVTLNRDKLRTEQAEKSKTKETTSTSKQKQTSASKKSSSSRSTSSSKKRSTPSSPKMASYLRINNQYGDVTDYPAYSGEYKTFYVYTDGRDYNVSMLPSWCRVTNKNSSSFTVFIDSNNSHEDRSDWFFVKSDSKEVKVHLKQSGKPISITASYYSGYLTHRYYLNGVEYMKVNATIRVSGAKNLKLLAVATVQNKYGNSIYAASSYSNYAFNDGTFYAASELTPTSDDYSTYTVTVYVPNNALRLYKKKNKLTCRLSLYCERTGEFITNASYMLSFKAMYKNGTVTTKDR